MAAVSTGAALQQATKTTNQRGFNYPNWMARLAISKMIVDREAKDESTVQQLHDALRHTHYVTRVKSTCSANLYDQLVHLLQDMYRVYHAGHRAYINDQKNVYMLTYSVSGKSKTLSGDFLVQFVYMMDDIRHYAGRQLSTQFSDGEFLEWIDQTGKYEDLYWADKKTIRLHEKVLDEVEHILLDVIVAKQS